MTNYIRFEPIPFDNSRRSIAFKTVKKSKKKFRNFIRECPACDGRSENAFYPHSALHELHTTPHTKHSKRIPVRASSQHRLPRLDLLARVVPSSNTSSSSSSHLLISSAPHTSLASNALIWPKIALDTRADGRNYAEFAHTRQMGCQKLYDVITMIYAGIPARWSID